MRALARWYVVAFVASTSCGGRYSITSDAPLGNAGGGASPSAGGTSAGGSPQAGRSGANGGAGAASPSSGGSGMASAAGSVHAGGAASAGTAGKSAGAGAAGSAASDDPLTIGDERPGKIACPGFDSNTLQQQVTLCQSTQQCCVDSGHCVSSSDKCASGRLTCDGNEDCATGEQCCRIDKTTSSCAKSCPGGSIKHWACNGPCSDIDGDGIPDSQDACPVSQREDGKGPLPEDGCGDGDGDGIIDGKDQCPTQLEDGKQPKPADGCPA